MVLRWLLGGFEMVFRWCRAGGFQVFVFRLCRDGFGGYDGTVVVLRCFSVSF